MIELRLRSVSVTRALAAVHARVLSVQKTRLRVLAASAAAGRRPPGDLVFDLPLIIRGKSLN